jgi:hypothetical protein
MEKRNSIDGFINVDALMAQLRKDRQELKLRMHLARCCIRKDWEKAEQKWQRLQATGNHSLDATRQLAQELKKIYILIYRSLLIKSQQLLENVDNVIQETQRGETTALMTLKRQSIMELQTMRLNLEALAGAEPELFKSLKAEPLCACLKPQPEEYALLDPDQTEKANNDYF